MRGLGRFGVACLAALTIAATLGIAPADAVPVNYRPTPFVGWSTNGPVRAVLVVGDTVYAGGDFTTVTSPTGQTLTRGRLAAWDMKTGGIRTGFVADTNGRVESLATDGNSLFVGGDYTQIKGRNVARVSSLNLTTGNVNTGFSAGATSHVYALRVKGNRLYVGGAFNTLAGQPRADRRGQHDHRCARPRLQPERGQRGPRDRGLARRQHGLRGRRLPEHRWGRARLASRRCRRRPARCSRSRSSTRWSRPRRRTSSTSTSRPAVTGSSPGSVASRTRPCRGAP